MLNGRDNPICLAVVFSLFAKIANLGSYYLVKKFDLNLSEVFLCVFLSSAFYIPFIGYKHGCANLFPQELTFWPFLFTLITGLTGFTDILAVKMMPLGDMLVTKFTSVVFSVILTPIILKIKLSVGKLSLALFQVFGNVFVIQPPIIFNQNEKYEHYPQYWTGFTFAMSNAVFASICFILVFKLKDQTHFSQLLFWQFLGYIFPLTLTFGLQMENKIFSLELSNSMVLLFTAFLVKLKLASLIYSSKLVEPIIPASLRLLEMPIGIAVDAIFFMVYPNYLSIFGSVIVVMAAAAIVTYDTLLIMYSNKKQQSIL